MTTADQLQKLLDAEGIRHFSAKEVLFRGARDALLRINTDPPRQLWPNIIPTLRALDALRAILGKPLLLVSIYRCPPYNRAIGGARNSQHVQFRACDVRSDHVRPSRIHAALLEMRDDGAWSGGLGKYNSFVHIDTRPSGNASWSG